MGFVSFSGSGGRRSSGGGGGGGDTIVTPWTTNIGVGGLASGSAVGPSPLDTKEAVLRKMTTTVYYPDITPPSFGISQGVGSLVKIGRVLDVLLSFMFDRGEIYNTWGAPDLFRAGAATAYTFIRANDTVYAVQPGYQYTVNEYVATKGVNTFKGKVAYAQGPQPKDSAGNDFDAPLPAGESPVQQTSFEAVYPIYATTGSVAALAEQSLQSMITGNYIEIQMAAETGGDKQAFDMANAWLTDRPLTAVQYFNTVANAWAIDNKIGDFATAATTHEVEGVAGIAYTRYTNTSPDRGTLRIRLIF